VTANLNKENEMNTITKAERDSIVTRQEKLMVFCRDTGLTNKRNGWTSYKPEQVEHLNPPTNDERAQVELYDFIHNVPTKYFLYVNEATGKATIWTGIELGTVRFGCAWKDNFGGTRVPITIQAVNGRTYHGTYFKSSGDYARVKLAKN